MQVKPTFRSELLYFTRQIFSHLAVADAKSPTSYVLGPTFLGPNVVSTIIPGAVLESFFIVEPITKECGFLLLRHSCSKKLPVEKES